MSNTSETALPTIQKSTVTEQVFQVLRQRILNNEFSLDERLIDTEIASRLAVSRTPVREAIRMLEAEGLVVRKAQGNVIVAKRTLDDMVDAFHARIALESYIAKLAAEAVTDRELEELTAICEQLEAAAERDDPDGLKRWAHAFHRRLMEVGGNRRIARTIEEINDHISVYRERLYSSGEYRAANVHDHREILNTLRDHAGERARQLTEVHLTQALSMIRAIWTASAWSPSEEPK